MGNPADQPDERVLRERAVHLGWKPDRGDDVFAPVRGELRRIVIDGSLRAEIDFLVRDPELAVG